MNAGRQILNPLIKQVLRLVFAVIMWVSAAGIANANQDDGPYLRYTGQGLEASWLCNGKIVRKEFSATRDVVVAPVCATEKSITVRAVVDVFPAPVKFQSKKVAAISDIHGQFSNMKRLLQVNGIIDQELNWTFGDGHLVVTGDVLDRGDGVTEALWLLYALDAQAKTAGGALHLLLGNHEVLVMANDLRYIHPKYGAVADALGLSYAQLFDNDSVLGRWLRSKPVIVQVNDSLFMHAGLHPDYANLKASMSEVNEHFRHSLGLSKSEISKDGTLAFLYGRLGPIWYRGYFLKPQITPPELDQLLAQMQVARIVVGHTTMHGVLSHYEGKVISIDADLRGGKVGEVLLMQDGKLLRGTLTGEQLPVPTLSQSPVGTD
jgi:Calcineurin-like phosphoesterase